jgi:hypothetical protein
MKSVVSTCRRVAGVGKVSIVYGFECAMEGGHCCVRGERIKCEGVGDEVDVHHPSCVE